MRRIIYALCVASATVILAASCVKERQSLEHQEGSPILFGASTTWQNEPETRTEYSGVNENGNPVDKNSQYERIDWVSGSDWFRIVCVAAGNGPYDDYSVRSSSGSGQVSYANVYSVSGNGLQWGSSGTDHYFYAFYPAAGMESNYEFGADKTVSSTNASISAVGSDKARVTGIIPAVQNVVFVSSTQSGKAYDEYKANMNYAYMYARQKVTAGSTGAVNLDFHPLVTSFEITLKGDTGDLIEENLTKVELTSPTSSLTGTFEADLSDSGAPDISTSGEGKSITVNLPDGGVALSAEKVLKITLLALPVDQTNLTLTMHFGASKKRSLALKRNGSFITVNACKKAYVQNITVPDDVYFFDVEGPTSYFENAGETRSNAYTVRSSHKKNGTETPVGWQMVAYSTDDGATWTTSSTAPSWLSSGSTFSDETGSTTAKGYTINVTSDSGSHTSRTWKGSTEVVGSSSAPVDLSLQDIYGNPIAMTTANCYVVSKPGWYKFPCVYGNAIKNGADNQSAYKLPTLTAAQQAKTGRKYLQAFLNYNDQPISGPWITKPTTESGVNKGDGFTPVSGNEVKIVWQDKPDLVTQLSYNSHYIFFYVAPASIQEGNAVISLNAGGDGTATDGSAYWSWHIWVMEDIEHSDNLKTTSVYHPAPGNYYSSIEGVTQMLNVNLGWYGSDTLPRSVKIRLQQNDSGRTAEITINQRMSGQHASGGNTLYQWGRKDAFPGFDEFYGDDQERFHTWRPHITNRTIGWTIHFPWYFALNSAESMHDLSPTAWPELADRMSDTRKRLWCYDTYDNLWNMHGTMDEDIPVVKTVYDPCPVGFKMPNRNAFTRFSICESYNLTGTGTTRAINGWQLGVNLECFEGDTQGIFFPATSLREANNGEVRGETVFCWTASRQTHDSEDCAGVYLECGSASTLTPMAHAACETYGFSVRPIKE